MSSSASTPGRLAPSLILSQLSALLIFSAKRQFHGSGPPASALLPWKALAQFPSPQSWENAILPAPRSFLTPSLLPPANPSIPYLSDVTCAAGSTFLVLAPISAYHPGLLWAQEVTQGGHSSTSCLQVLSFRPRVLVFLRPKLRGKEGAEERVTF